MTAFIPNRWQAAQLVLEDTKLILASPGSPQFREKLDTYVGLHDACAAAGRSDECPCAGCSPGGPQEPEADPRWVAALADAEAHPERLIDLLREQIRKFPEP